MLMRTAIAVIAPCLLIATAAPAQAPTFTLAQVGWIAGNWDNTAAGSHLEEHWTQPEGGVMLGMSRTVRNGKPTEFEFLRIEARPDGVYYVAQPQGRPPVDFKLTSVEGGTATFSNPGNADHLKHIIYRRNTDGSLTARIEGSNGGKEFSEDFPYRRVKP